MTALSVPSEIELNGRKITVTKLLGRGALGASYLLQEVSGEERVLKIFDASYLETFKQRLHQYKESRFASSETVIGYSEAGLLNGHPFLTHALVSHRSFDDFCRSFRFDPKKPEAAVEPGIKLCRAAAMLHHSELIHGHLWNGNVFFTHQGEVVVVDPFIGAPTPVEISGGKASASRLSLYLAPEQRDINGHIDPRTDVWHIGALLCRLYTGKPDLAINELSLRELYKAKVPLSLIRVLWQAIHVSPHSRYSDVVAFETALTEAFEPEHRKTVYVRPLPYAPGVKDGWSRPLRNVFVGVAAIAIAAFSLYYMEIGPFAKVQAATTVSISVAPEPEVTLTIPREFRAAWISTVHNGSWPSKSGLPVAEQQRELIAILDEAKKLNLNAVLFQARSAADAMYNSQLEPWSEFLTGTQGQPPTPYYDPLEFAVAEAHRRGLQLHVWMNPFRAATRDSGQFAANHVSNTLPQAVKKLNKVMWFDPGSKQAQDHIVSVIRDVVSRYDIDGVQFDDYFYPYANSLKDVGGFPDTETWYQYQSSGGQLNRSDWRRENVNQVIRTVNESIKSVKPNIYFGIAPFGIWRPGYPEGTQGMDSYDNLYADSRKWLQEGWVDYLSPQLYWDLSKKQQSFPKILDWWTKQNPKSRHIWPAISVSSVGKSFPPDDVIKRIAITRSQPGASGMVLFGLNNLIENTANISTILKTSAYSAPALAPPSPWLDDKAPQPVSARLSSNSSTGNITVEWDSPEDSDGFLVAVYCRAGNVWRYDIVPITAQTYSLSPDIGNLDAVVVSLIDRSGNESEKRNVALGSH